MHVTLRHETPGPLRVSHPAQRTLQPPSGYGFQHKVHVHQNKIVSMLKTSEKCKYRTLRDYSSQN
ncbi:uncharacterized protein PHALS_09923 [Plasmopara halstedii]|uniref:Uncharacterized protein n=1 Tax=Plasmopara halstedii TaxID=4781 RepID=A0A0P1AGH9_PLAHL|nr:uncharacterized protein PHALS_09923 [Plasmopara halstedii]CEG39687.1 hypothetical protein PHALS_09923 [Plasmopara halstedii]|eukprot:XP_024576056.1 hypothetical protein PHALS_09923 [Plasmopara halstedii]